MAAPDQAMSEESTFGPKCGGSADLAAERDTGAATSIRGRYSQRLIFEIYGIANVQFIGVFIGSAEPDILLPIGSSSEFDAMNLS
jgi:hypothetical protein